MGFGELYTRISPKLRSLACRVSLSSNGSFDKDDLFQEMSVHLWNKFSQGLPQGINEAYAVMGCRFYILNFLRKNRTKARILSIDLPLNAEGETLKDILPNTEEPLEKRLDRKMALDYIRNNGFTKKEKEAFSLLTNGYTAREAGAKLGVSHVMVLKYKKRIISALRGQAKENI